MAEMIVFIEMIIDLLIFGGVGVSMATLDSKSGLLTMNSKDSLNGTINNKIL
jgi:hypothetical protein